MFETRVGYGCINLPAKAQKYVFNPAKYKAYSNSSFGTHKDEIDVAAYTATTGNIS